MTTLTQMTSTSSAELWSIRRVRWVVLALTLILLATYANAFYHAAGASYVRMLAAGEVLPAVTFARLEI